MSVTGQSLQTNSALQACSIGLGVVTVVCCSVFNYQYFKMGRIPYRALFLLPNEKCQGLATYLYFCRTTICQNSVATLPLWIARGTCRCYWLASHFHRHEGPWGCWGYLPYRVSILWWIFKMSPARGPDLLDWFSWRQDFQLPELGSRIFKLGMESEVPFLTSLSGCPYWTYPRMREGHRTSHIEVSSGYS